MADAEHLDDCLLGGCVDGGTDVDCEGIDGDDERYDNLLAQRPVLRVARIVWAAPVDKAGLVLLKFRPHGGTLDGSRHVVCR